MAALTYTDVLTKLRAQSSTNEAGILTQLVQDYNTGYLRLLAKLDRYWVRKQQFANLVAAQQFYQLPVDFKSIEAVSVQVTTSYRPPLTQIRSEEEWRRMTSYPQQSSWPSYFYVIGQREIGLWPIPAASVTLGLRIVYHPRAFALSVADLTNAATASITNGSQTVTLSSGILSTDQTGLFFQVTGVLDDTFYAITASTASTLTLEAPIVASTATGLAWRISQLPYLPSEYTDVPVHYSLWLYFAAAGNEVRASLHKKFYEDGRKEALATYSSSSETSVITDETPTLNVWLTPPPAA